MHNGRRRVSLFRVISAMVLILIGVGFTLQTLGLLPHPFISYVQQYGFAIIIVVLALSQFVMFFVRLLTHGQFSFLRLTAAIVLFMWVTPQSNGHINLTVSHLFTVAWPIVIIAAGCALLFGGGSGKRNRHQRHQPVDQGPHVAGMHESVSQLPIAQPVRVRIADSARRAADRGGSSQDGDMSEIEVMEGVTEEEGFVREVAEKTHLFIGEVTMGGHVPWTFKDASLWHFIGDVTIDLRQAVLEPREYQLSIRGVIGDVTIIVPPTLPVRILAEIRIGEIRIFDETFSGLGRSGSYESPCYAEADRKLDLVIALKVGDIGVTKA